MKNLWVLTEERPKTSVLKMIFEYFAKENKCDFFAQKLMIVPLLNDDKTFSFTYEVTGFECSKIEKVFIKTVSGYSSFVDFLIFYQKEVPQPDDEPTYAIEETKTDDSESRNTGVYQRCSKFVFIRHYYPNVKLIMLYALAVKQKEIPTQTYIFGTRLLMTFGVEILGKVLDSNVFKPFGSIQELVDFKNSMPPPRAYSNTPIAITILENEIQVSGRLYKNGGISHDPNIGALSIICAVIRKLGFCGELRVIRHGLEQKHLGKTNKFIQIANALNIKLHNLNLPITQCLSNYWKYETEGEKLGTIFIHVVVENFTVGYSVFENHAGCEKGYFITGEGEHLALEKYNDRAKYKAGDKGQIIYIPDLVMLDLDEKEAVNIEGKKYSKRKQGIEELDNYDSFERKYLAKFYPEFEILRTVVLYGSKNENIMEDQVGFLLNEDGKMILGASAPALFVKAINNLIDYWRVIKKVSLE